QILANLGQPDATMITVDDTLDVAKIFGQTRFNGDGLITEDSASDAATKQVVAEIISTHGSELDRSGKPGISQAKVDAFFADATAFSDWNKKAETEGAVILPLGDTTIGAYGTFKAVEVKIEDYFARCRLAAFDPRAISAVNRQESEFVALGAKDLTANSAEIASFPLARVEPNKALPLHEGVNPAWADALTNFHQAVIVPILGKTTTTLTEADWKTVKSKLAPFEAWSGTKAGALVEVLGLKRVREILASKAKDSVTLLIGEDNKLAAEADNISNVEKLARYYRDLHKLLLNYVSFQDFYGRKRKSIFQVGTLYLDARSCDLCVRVEDAGKHAALAGLAKAYLVYCDCTRLGEKLTIAAAFTDGDADNLMLGRNGIFYDRKGQDWDATIVKIIENPISIREAFWSPYKKLVRMIEEQVAKRAAAADSAANANLVSAGALPTPATPAIPPPADPKKIDVGTVAALGVAVGAIGTALATVFAKATGLWVLPFWQICLVFLALLLCVSSPSVLMAWLKLRQRNLGPILDANGWAVNGRMKVNVPLGRSLTQVAKIPAGSSNAADDPFAERPTPWPKIFVVVIVICFVISLLNDYGLLNGVKQKLNMGTTQTGVTNGVPGSVNQSFTNGPATNVPAINTHP
ncbi:MAG TPA: hypothetical protein VH255_03420, partial [Verrucomicrobiae bacterium]|nr:hypothetical protein [Verrucomicrobiae bacterium]